MPTASVTTAPGVAVDTPAAEMIMPSATNNPAADASGSAPHIAIILPTQGAGSLASAAAVVYDGAQAAEKVQGGEGTPPLRLYPVGEGDDDALMAYETAVQAGAVGVIGPLTRGAIARLAARGKLEIPVLALNTLAESKPVTNLYTMDLAVEEEARQLVSTMHAAGINKPLLLQAEGSLAHRAGEAFMAEWRRQFGHPPQMLTLAGGRDGIWTLKDTIAKLDCDGVLLAADGLKARMARPFIGNGRPVYAISQIWDGRFGKTSGMNADLAGVKFLDMPWLLDPWSTEMVNFERPTRKLSADLLRLYALGIDAYRMSLLLIVAAPGSLIEMQGVSGDLRLDDHHQIERELMLGTVGDMPRTAQPKPAEPSAVPVEVLPSPVPNDTPVQP